MYRLIVCNVILLTLVCSKSHAVESLSPGTEIHHDEANVTKLMEEHWLINEEELRGVYALQYENNACLSALGRCQELVIESNPKPTFLDSEWGKVTLTVGGFTVGLGLGILLIGVIQ